MPNTCTVLLVKSPFAEGLVRMCQTACFMQWAHLHKRANGCCKNQESGHGKSVPLDSAIE